MTASGPRTTDSPASTPPSSSAHRTPSAARAAPGSPSTSAHVRRVDALPRDAHLPLGLRVVRLEFLVRERPVDEPGARHTADQRRLVELPGGGASCCRRRSPFPADHAAVAVGARCGLVVRGAPERCSAAGRVAHELVVDPPLSFRYSSFVTRAPCPYLPQPPCSSTTTVKPASTTAWP